MQTSSGDVSPISPLAGSANQQSQAPKYGTLIPNRIFVGGIAAQCTEHELKAFFAEYGAVKDCKIIADRAGVSKGYGFVTFECQEDAEKIIKTESDNLMFKDRKLNIGPAIRKTAFPGPRLYEPSLSPTSTLLYHTNGVPYTFQNGMAVFHPQEGYSVPTQPQPSYPMVVGGSPMYAAALNQAGTAGYSYPSPSVGGTTSAQWTAAAAAAATAGQWRWAAQSPMAGSTSQYMYQTPFLHQAGEVIYAQPSQAYATAGDMTDAAAMQQALEAAAQPSEGSSTVEVSTPARHYAETSSLKSPESQFLLRQQQQQQQSSAMITKSPIVYPSFKCHMPSNIYASPPPTPNMATPVKILTSQPQHLLTTPPMMTKDRSDLDELRRANALTPPITPQPEIC